MGRNFKLIFNKLLSILILINTHLLVILKHYTNFNLKLTILCRINRIKLDLFVFLDNYTYNFKLN